MTDARKGTYGSRARIGLLVPSTNTVGESEFWRLAPDGVSVHTSRMPFLPEKHDQPFEAMERQVPRVLEEAGSAAPDVIAYGCTASSAKGDPAALEAELSQESGRPTATAAAATPLTSSIAVSSLRLLWLRRLLLLRGVRLLLRGLLLRCIRPWFFTIVVDADVDFRRLLAVTLQQQVH